MINFFKKYKKHIFGFLTLILLIVFSLGFYVGYQAKKPIKMPKYYLSNNSQKIVFQTMIHVGTEDFYKKVIDDVKYYKDLNYKYLYEMVHIEKKEDGDELKALLSIDPEKQLILSKILDVKHQTDYIYHIDKSVDINADVTAKELSNLILKHHLEVNKTDDDETKTSGYFDDLKDISDNKKYIVKNIFRVLINVLMDNPEMMKDSSALFSNVVVDKRNEILFDYVKKNSDKNLIINYGYLHFMGFFELLKKEDPNWKIEKTEYYIAL